MSSGYEVVKIENQHKINLNGLKGEKVVIIIRQTEIPDSCESVDAILTGISKDFSHVFFNDDPTTI